MLERLRRWWRRLWCRFYGDDDEKLWSEVYPLLPPEPKPDPVEVPNGLVLSVTTTEYLLDAYELSEWRCRRCGRHTAKHGHVSTGQRVERVQYIELPADRYEKCEGGVQRKQA